MRKHLAENLVLSKVNFAAFVFQPLPAFQMERLQRVENACAGFVIRKFAGVEGVAKLNWLLVNKTVKLNILKFNHKSLYDDTFPQFLKLNLYKISSCRTSIAPVFSNPRESDTFSTRQQLFLALASLSNQKYN